MRLRLALVALAVLAMHLLVADWFGDQMADMRRSVDEPKRMSVAYVRELKPSAPVVSAAASVVARKPAAVAQKPKRAEAPPPPAASAALPAVDEPASAVADSAAASSPDSLLAQAESAVDTDAASPGDAAASAGGESAVAAPVADAASAPADAKPFEWPASTRLSYVLTGNYRGEVHGTAQVEWVREDSHYQVHLDVVVGAGFAPLFTRRMSSDGQITPRGLAPRRYDEDSKLAFQARRVHAVLFENEAVVLANGARMPHSGGVQDSASQFVQLTWLFSTRPELLQVGKSIEVPLALPRSLDNWVYDVLESETLTTPFGALEALHLKPRRSVASDNPRSNALSAEIWFAPTLAYLPVRIRIHQSADTFVDLMISRLPQMAAPVAAPTAAPPADADRATN
ncbi:hypothetical protein BH09PSE5_BH09PSE5_43660 [soil metagenome]